MEPRVNGGCVKEKKPFLELSAEGSERCCEEGLRHCDLEKKRR